jgi:hypothetical protein
MWTVCANDTRDVSETLLGVARYFVLAIMVHGTKLVFRGWKVPKAPTSFPHLVTAWLTTDIPSCKSKGPTITETLPAKESIKSIELLLLVGRY